MTKAEEIKECEKELVVNNKLKRHYENELFCGLNDLDSMEKLTRILGNLRTSNVLIKMQEKRIKALKKKENELEEKEEFYEQIREIRNKN